MEKRDLRADLELCEKATPIAGAPGYYITPSGRVYSTKNWRGHGVLELSATENSHGYLRVRLVINGRRVSKMVHKLVAEAFLPPRPSSKHEIRHLDGDKHNNAASNLAWGTRKENASDRDRHGRTARGSANGEAKLTEEQVVEIKQRLGKGESQRKLAAAFSVSQAAIGYIARRETWAHVN